jgi:anti-sigma factor RsiW
VTEKLNGASRMIHCDDAREAISAAIDGELDPVEQAALNVHLRSCRQCDSYIKSAFALHVRLRGELTDERDTDGLWKDILPLIHCEAAAAAQIAEGPRGARLSRRAAVFSGIAATLLIAAGAVMVRELGRPGQPQVVAETTNDFLTFRASGRRLDVASLEAQEIKDWLAARVDFELPFSASPPAGFRLAGGRLCSFLNRRLVALQYEQGNHAATLYVMNETGLTRSLDWNRDADGRALSVTSLKGVTNVVWRGGGLLYVVVSDLSEVETVNFAASL